jgi:hypothetical protein
VKKCEGVQVCSTTSPWSWRQPKVLENSSHYPKLGGELPVFTVPCTHMPYQKKTPEKNCMGKASFLVVRDRHGLAELFVMQEKRPAKHTSLVSQNLQSLIRWHERRNGWDPKDL